ncbi:sugar isomerase domain-containing protein [Paenisporosarcina sp. TG-14]|uniref:sugar isomerase domain-containing protein n=1 Tax=Paenisporosarcina sp. TG-14 TaxID=1231057 RepID=UPI0002D7A7CC|nr:SIS domain-containing protein [Paenisporosarcina sp. TG-14]
MISYFTAIDSLMKKVFLEDKQAVKRIADEMTKRLSSGGIIQLFGCGHSHLIAQEPYYRSGGLVPVCPIFVEPLMLHDGAIESSKNEKDPDFIHSFVGQLDIRPEDTVIVISTSGRNPVPIEVAMKAKEREAYTISIQSLCYSGEKSHSKHISGKRLEDVVDDVLNTHVPIGDGLLETNGLLYAPASSVIGNTLLHATFTSVIEKMIENGLEPPIFKSGNVDGSTEHNEQLVQKYKERILF